MRPSQVYSVTNSPSANTASRTIREFRLNRGCIEVGEALTDFRGILTGVPIYETPALVKDEPPR